MAISVNKVEDIFWGGFLERGYVYQPPPVLPPAGAGRGLLCSALLRLHLHL